MYALPYCVLQYNVMCELYLLCYPYPCGLYMLQWLSQSCQHLLEPPQRRSPAASVIALMFFALFSRPSPSFKPYDLTTLSLFLYPNNHYSFLFLYLPLFTRVKNKTKRPMAFFWQFTTGTCVLVLLLLRDPSPTRLTHPTLLTQTREPRHLRTPTTGLAMGQDPRNQEGDPPPRPTEEPTSRESNCPPARNRSIDSRWAALTVVLIEILKIKWALVRFLTLISSLIFWNL